MKSYYYTSIRMAKNKNKIALISNTCKVSGKLDFLHVVCEDVKMIQSQWKIFSLWKIGFIDTYMHTHIRHALALQPTRCIRVFIQKAKTYTHRKICRQLFIPALFVIARNWKQTKCPSVGGQFNKWWCFYCHGILLRNKNK